MVRKLSAFLIMLVISAPVGFAAELLYWEDFEGPNGNEWRTTNNGIYDTYDCQPWAVVVDTLAQSGGRALRSNWISSRTDPITGQIGQDNNNSNAILAWDFGGLRNNTPNSVYISYHARIDSFVWIGDSGATSFMGKTGYIMDDDDGTGFMYYISHRYDNGSGANTGFLEPNGSDAQKCSSSWTVRPENWGVYSAGYNHPSVYNDGKWHKFELYFNYQENYMMMWTDGVLWGPRHNDGLPNMTNGKLPIPDETHIRGIYMFHVSNINQSRNGPGGGIAGGWMVDNIEVWDDYPGAGDLGAPQVPQPVTLGR